MQEIAFGFPAAKSFSFEDENSAGGKKARKIKKRLEPQIRFAEFLLSLFKSLKTKLAVVLLDDVQNLLAISETVDILRSVLSKDEILSQTRYLFILAATPEGWSSFVDKHDPVGRFFRRRESIGFLTMAETEEIIHNSLMNSGVIFEKELTEKIFSYTQGHPYELQLLCSHLYDSQIAGVVSSQQWESAFCGTFRLCHNYRYFS